MSALVLMVLSIFVIFVFSDSSDEIPVKCLVLDKVQTNVRSAMLYLIVKDDGGEAFDISVNPTTFSQCKVGYMYTFYLTKSRMGVNRQPVWVDAVFMVLGLFSALWLVYAWPEDDDEQKPRGAGGMSTSRFVMLSGGGFLLK